MEKKTVLIEDIANELEGATDEWKQYLNTETGEIVSVPSSDNIYIDRELVDEELAEEIEHSNKYVRLPNQYEIHEYRIMEEFAYATPKQRHQENLLYVLRGRKPYRNFKDKINYLGLAEGYYAYRFLALCKLAMDWCEEYEIPYNTKDKKRQCHLVKI